MRYNLTWINTLEGVLQTREIYKDANYKHSRKGNISWNFCLRFSSNISS